MDAPHFSQEEEALLRRWWALNRPHGKLSFHSQGDGNYQVAELHLTLKPPLARWIRETAGTPGPPRPVPA